MKNEELLAIIEKWTDHLNYAIWTTDEQEVLTQFRAMLQLSMNKEQKEMLECLREWFDLYYHEVNCSEKYLLETLDHHEKAYTAIRILIMSGQRTVTQKEIADRCLGMNIDHIAEWLRSKGIEVK